MIIDGRFRLNPEASGSDFVEFTARVETPGQAIALKEYIDLFSKLFDVAVPRQRPR